MRPPRGGAAEVRGGGKPFAGVVGVPACASQLAAATVFNSIVVAMPGGKPVMEVPDETPMGPITTVLPALVMVVAAQTPKFRVIAPRAKAYDSTGAQITPRVS